ncbi:MAG: hypothetical protein IT428_32520 [Planctomycetaceae bacterium]|nr:hypothetical protein [Planctomycetaceae bacterium]
MATTLTLNLDDNAARGFAEVARQISEAAGAAGKLESAAEKADDALNPQTVAALRAELKGLASEYDNVADEAKKAGDQAKGVGDSSGKMTAIASTVTAGIETFRMFREGVQMAREKIHELAELGIPEFESLDRSISETSSSLNHLIVGFGKGTGSISLLENALNGVQYVFDTLSGVTQEERLQIDGLAKAMKTLDDISTAVSAKAQQADIQRVDSLTQVRDAIEHQKQLIEELGKLADQSDNERALQAQKLVDLHNQEAALLQRRAENEKFLADFRKQGAAEAEANDLKQITSLEQINQLISDQVYFVQQLSDRDSVSAEEMQQTRERLTRLDQRRKDLIREVADAEKKAAEDARQLAEKSERETNEIRQRELEEYARIEQRKREELKRTAEQAARDAEAKFRQNVEGMMRGPTASGTQGQSVEIERKTQEQIAQIRQQQIQQYVTGDVKGFFESQKKQLEILQQSLEAQRQLREKFAKEGSPLEQIKASFTDKDIGKAVEDQRATDAVKKLTEKRQEEWEAFQRQRKEGRSGVSEEENRMADRLRRDAERAERQARGQARRDIRRGNVSEQEVNQATNNLVQATINAAEKNGDVGKETAQTLRAGIEAQQKAAEVATQQAAEIKELQETARQVADQLNELGVSQRGRAMKR